MVDEIMVVAPAQEYPNIQENTVIQKEPHALAPQDQQPQAQQQVALAIAELTYDKKHNIYALLQDDFVCHDMFRTLLPFYVSHVFTMLFLLMSMYISALLVHFGTLLVTLMLRTLL